MKVPSEQAQSPGPVPSPNSRMKVIFYIGHHKVGSSAIQVYLAQNALKLLQHDILYPCVDMQGFSNMLARAVKFGDRDVRLPANIGEPHSALAYKMLEEQTGFKIPSQFRRLPSVRQMLHAIRSQVAQLQPRRVLLCSEIFSYFGQLAPTQITRLRDLFPNADLQIYCALRRPDDYLISLHGQGLKVGDRTDSLREQAVSSYLHSVHFDFRLMVEPWMQLCPEANVTIRNYDDILAAGGSVQDFKSAADCDFPEDTIPAGIRNKGLLRPTFEIVRRANRDLPAKTARDLVRHLLETQGNYDLPVSRDIEMFDPAARAMLYREFQPIHDYLSRTTNKQAFFPDLADMQTPRPIPELDSTRMLLDQMSPEEMPDAETRTFISKLKKTFGSRKGLFA